MYLDIRASFWLVSNLPPSHSQMGHADVLGLGKAMRGIDISNNVNLKVSGESDGLNSIPNRLKSHD